MNVGLNRGVWDWLSARFSWFYRHCASISCVYNIQTRPSCVKGLFGGIRGLLFCGGPQTEELAGVAISMDGKGRVFDNIFVERLWRTVKFEEVYLHEYETPAEAR